MLSQEQWSRIETELFLSDDARGIAALLCLHMGLSIAEAAGLKWGDIDLEAGTLCIERCLVKSEGGVSVSPAEARRISIPPHIHGILSDRGRKYAGECFVISGTPEPAPFYGMQNFLNSVAARCGLDSPLSAGDLRDAFIRRAVIAGMDMFSLLSYCGVKRADSFIKKYGGLFAFRDEPIMKLGAYSTAGDSVRADAAHRRIGLLVLGAGKNRRGVRRIADRLGICDEMMFLDDDPDADGPLSACASLRDRYQIAIVCFGNATLREKYTNLLESLGYVIPSFRHPMAAISPKAKLDSSVMIGDGAVIRSGAIVERGVLIANGAVIEQDARIGKFTSVGANARIMRNAVVPPRANIPAGAVVEK